MIILIGAFLVSIIPAAGAFYWFRENMRKGQPIEPEYKRLCNSAIIRGLVSAAPIILVSFLINIIENFMPGLSSLPPAPKQFFHDMFVLAFAEELVKYLMFRGLMKKNPDYPYGWLDVIVFMVSVGIGFELIEGVVYAFGSGPGHMLVRGITAMHAGFAFIMGYFMGKGMKTGDKKYTVLGFVVPWIMHGLYDFSLSEEATALNSDIAAIVAVGLALLCLVIFVYMIFFMRKARENEEFVQAL